ncbi:ABC transporter ATP-binding protein [Aureibacillus halotolerans]|uniref:Oligopeptide transport system ATP-binding protein n=1 Tax=Aureibacillus halotolerans TaxID=1508390 RepID=A0A4R6U025_9BACI|nr:ABC transporter ATP-binding protein [Aureibacillus halotolerans]TDQ37679.1 oligopeptide transport system ATP-binding protein [Aureibacillus halotolerans]
MAKQSAAPLLSVQNLATSFSRRGQSNVRVVDDVSFEVAEGEVVAIVGESGSGKSMTALSVIGLLKRGGNVVSGSIAFQGENLTKLSAKERRRHHGKDMAMIFQEPMSSLNPMMRIKAQLAEAVAIHQRSLSKKDIYHEVLRLLELVDIPDPKAVAERFPHQLSGGMRQRIVIAFAIAHRPKLLIADEPTTALDVTVQANILDLIHKLHTENQTGVIFITHDLNVVAEMADRVLVMYAGRIVEESSVYNLFDDPKHPYTIGLMEAMPTLDELEATLASIPGTAPDLANLPEGCPFHPRCPKARAECKSDMPPLRELRQGHSVRCLFPGKEEENLGDTN